MYEKYLALDENKRDIILRAALQEFGKYGYKKTSVEQIAESAGISKSMVFHYFGSKLSLFEFLASFTADFGIGISEKFLENIEDLDYIGQYERAAKIKLEAYRKNKEAFDFIGMLYLNPENTLVSTSIKEEFNKNIKYRNKILKILSSSKNDNFFRTDLNIDSSKKYINWIIDGYSAELTQRLIGESISHKNFDEDWKDFDKMILDLKRLFYKEKYQ